MTTAMLMSGKRPPGWYSRRHQTNAAHVEAQRKWRDERSPEARRRRADERSAIATAWREKFTAAS